MATAAQIARLSSDYRNFLYKYGRNSAVGTTEEVIWDGGGAYTGLDLGENTIEIVSASTDDAVGGGGATAVFVQGQGADGIEISETVSLNGTTGVELTNKFEVIYRMKVTASEDADPFTGPNHGIIKVYPKGSASDVMAQINATNGQTLMCYWRCPSNRWGAIQRMTAYIPASKVMTVKMLYRNADTDAWNVAAYIDATSTPSTVNFACNGCSQLVQPMSEWMVTALIDTGASPLAADFTIHQYDIQNA